MQKRSLRMSKIAAEDIETITRHIALDSPAAAARMLTLLYTKSRLLLESPEMGRRREELLPGLRSLVVLKYIIFYTITDEFIEIVRILHGYRDVDSLF